MGLIAGEGVFPLLVARGARAAGRRVVCTAFAGHAWPDLARECDEFHWVSILRLGKWIKHLKRAGCTEAIMVGRVQKAGIYDRWRYFRYIPDLRTVSLMLRVIRKDKRPNTILMSLVSELEAAGITLMDSTIYTPDQLATPGVMGRRQPTEQQWQDIRYGFEICRSISRLDIGQTIAVIDRDVIAVEAVEGTNAMIERAGKLCRTGGWTMIKVSNTHQDMRVDVPTVGTVTIEKLATARAGCLVLEPGKTVLLEKPKVIELADRHKIAVVGWDASISAPAPT
ncbi:MAG TPA: UDP-2,3-diacylglucosamine diphosphatase LpxI [Tepidisphaeraceae bacterium]